jgi:GMP synthase-like glutamine amidotransferase
MRIQVFQHVPFEGLGSIGPWAAEKGHTVHTCELFRNEPLPDPEQFDWLMVLGGPMGVYDEAQHPWLVGEKRLIEAALRAEKTVLGICLGAQLIATVLGKKVTRNPQREIGWFPLQLTRAAHQIRIFDSLPNQLTAFHWHGDTFEIPEGAIHLASSAACVNQAYLYGKRVLGLQFHLETTPTAAQALVTHCADELTAGECIQSPAEILASPPQFETINAIMRVILERLAV